MSAPPLQGPIRIEVVDRLGPHAAAWDEVVADQPLPSPFLRSWWVDHLAGGQPAVVLVHDGERLLGGAAFELDTVGGGAVRLERVRMLGQGVLAPDHLDLVAATGHHPHVARAVLSWLRRRGPRVIELDGLAATGTLARLFAPFEVTRTASPFASLGHDVDAYLAARPGAVRSTLTRSRKRFERVGASVRRADPPRVPDALDALASLHDLRWADGSSFLDAWERFRAGALVAARRGELVLHELVTADGDVAAIELDLVLGDRWGFYQAGRRTEREWRGCGSVVREAAIRAAAADGAAEYDLLRGDEAYKQDWATGRREIIAVLAGHGAAAEAAVYAAALRRRAGPRIATARARLSRGPWRGAPAAAPGPTG